MKWRRGYESGDVEDRRGGGGIVGGNMLPLLAMVFGRFGWRGLLILLALLLFFGRGLLGVGGGGGGGSVSDGTRRTHDDPRSFVGFVLDDVQTTWTKLFSERGRRYQPAHLVLFTDATETRCGYGTAAVGPFYCPRDNKVYIDLSFYSELRDRFGAPGDFAQAYVIAHEVGHHVQNQLGTMARVDQESPAARRGAGGSAVRLELQADCYAGVWARSAAGRELLERGDLEEGMTAAAAVGDDRTQRRGQGTVQPESWTHGSSEQRVRWFRRGYDTGDPAMCNTFDVAQL